VTAARKKKEEARAAAEPEPTRTRDRGPWVAALVTGAVAMGVYVAALAPTFVRGDSAELMVAVHVLGVPHPTGYPLFLLLGKAFEVLLPIGTVAYRLNLVSALYGAATAGGLAWVAARVSGRAWCGMAAGLMAALSQGLWSQSVAFEVYSLHALTVALMLAAVVRWEDTRSRQSAYLVALMAGLGLAHHRTSLFFSLPAWALCLWGTRGRDWKLALKMAGITAAPNLLYLLLIPLANRHPVMNWGAIHLGWRYWWWHVTGRQFAQWAFARSAAEALTTATEHWAPLIAQHTLVVPALAVVGLAATRRTVLRVATLSGFIFSAIYAYSNMVPDRLVFAMPTELVLVLWAAIGLGVVTAWLGRRRSGAGGRWPELVMAVAAVALVAHLLLVNWRAMDKRGDWRMYNESLNALQTLPPDVTLLVDADFTLHGSYPYLQHIEGYRRDVTVVPVDLVREHFGWANIEDPVVKRAAVHAYEISPPWPANPNLRAPWVYPPYLTRALMATKGKRRLFAQFDNTVRTSEYVWKDYGVFMEVLESWPEMEQPATGALPQTGTVNCVEVEVAPRSLRPGEVFHMKFRWQVRERLERLVPVLLHFPRVVPATGELEEGFGVQFPLAYGKVPLDANRPHHVYVQAISWTVPKNARPGKYAMALMGPSDQEGEVRMLPVTLEVER